MVSCYTTPGGVLEGISQDRINIEQGAPSGRRRPVHRLPSASCLRDLDEVGALVLPFSNATLILLPFGAQA